MLIIMGGLPKSGKTSIIRALKRSDIIHISPESLLPQNLDSQPEQLKSKLQIAAWESSLQKLSESITKDNIRTTIVFDTCGASIDPIRMALFKAKSMGHHVIYVFIDRNANDCAQHLAKEIIDSYRPKLARALKLMQQLVHKIHIISNKDIGSSSKAFDEIINGALQIH